MMPYRVLVTGSRHWYCLAMAERIVRKLADRHGEIAIIHGAAPGVDSAFESAVELIDRPEVVAWPHPAPWQVFGRRAGPLRNQAMVDLGADICIAVHPDLANSRGTKDCVRRAMDAGIPVWAVTAEDGVPSLLESL